jgi:hypothetical protein
MVSMMSIFLMKDTLFNNCLFDKNRLTGCQCFKTFLSPTLRQNKLECLLLLSFSGMCLVFRKAITKFVQAFLAFTSQPWDHSESGAMYSKLLPRLQLSD